MNWGNKSHRHHSFEWKHLIDIPISTEEHDPAESSSETKRKLFVYFRVEGERRRKMYAKA
jgi:hypothetical protein